MDCCDLHIIITQVKVKSSTALQQERNCFALSKRECKTAAFKMMRLFAGLALQ
jgi:hypothetical protein